MRGMSNPDPPPIPPRGRTWPSLREIMQTILWVIPVVIVLALIFFTLGQMLSGGRVMGTVKSTASQKVCIECAAAINSFSADYGHLPISPGTADWEGTMDDPGLLSALAASSKDPTNNPRHLNYLEGMQQAKSNGGHPINGIDYEADAENPKLYDPWGHAYRVRLDVDGDEELSNPAGQPPIIRGKKAIIWSAGPDGDFHTWEDNPRSW